jgi:hypothetical protein
MKFETYEFDAPAHWASAFINGDTSGLDDVDSLEFLEWCEGNPELLWVVDCTEEAHIGRFKRPRQTELLTYTCHLPGDAS